MRLGAGTLFGLFGLPMTSQQKCKIDYEPEDGIEPPASPKRGIPQQSWQNLRWWSSPESDDWRRHAPTTALPS